MCVAAALWVNLPLPTFSTPGVQRLRCLGDVTSLSPSPSNTARARNAIAHNFTSEHLFFSNLTDIR